MTVTNTTNISIDNQFFEQKKLNNTSRANLDEYIRQITSEAYKSLVSELFHNGSQISDSANALAIVGLIINDYPATANLSDFALNPATETLINNFYEQLNIIPELTNLVAEQFPKIKGFQTVQNDVKDYVAAKCQNALIADFQKAEHFGLQLVPAGNLSAFQQTFLNKQSQNTNKVAQLSEKYDYDYNKRQRHSNSKTWIFGSLLQAFISAVSFTLSSIMAPAAAVTPALLAPISIFAALGTASAAMSGAFLFRALHKYRQCKKDSENFKSILNRAVENASPEIDETLLSDYSGDGDLLLGSQLKQADQDQEPDHSHQPR